jgi:hypothetical protein
LILIDSLASLGSANNFNKSLLSQHWARALRVLAVEEEVLLGPYARHDPDDTPESYGNAMLIGGRLLGC